jgi:hypothetical protein
MYGSNVVEADLERDRRSGENAGMRQSRSSGSGLKVDRWPARCCT